MTVATVQPQSMTIQEMRAFVSTHSIVITGKKTLRSSFEAAIEAWNQSQLKADAIEAAEALAVEVAEVAAIAQPVATSIEDVAVEYGSIAVEYATSSDAVSFYRQALLGAVVGASIALAVAYSIVAAVWILLMDLADEHEAGLKAIRAVAWVCFEVKRSACVSDISGMVALYRPNAVKAWATAWGWLINLGWALAQGRRAVLGG
jgi:succinate dehydrogenase/fumarate reductase cytochrome b subunit